NMEGKEVADGLPEEEELSVPSRWILHKVNELTRDVTENMEKFELGIAVQKVYDFIWDEFCDWYIEMMKPVLYEGTDKEKTAALRVLRAVLSQALKLLHPFMPFVTEEIYCSLNPAEETIMTASWPVFREELCYKEEEEATELVKEAVRRIRDLRTSHNVSPGKKADVFVVAENEEILARFESAGSFFGTLAKAKELRLQTGREGISADAFSAVIPGAVVYIPLSELVDVKAERERLGKEAARLEAEIARSSGMLKNEKFVSRAPAEKVEAERSKLEKYTQMLEQVRSELAKLPEA
ncbi:MAG: class I tRNA ligase family protein, partial [Eubacterium sp.]|nr:class I tRNA ligase family protein [Eubacterium sp.]